MRISPEIQIMSTIKEGAVFYFIEDSFKSKQPHYFVVLNPKPLIDPKLLLAVAVTLDIKAIERIERLPFPIETYVTVTKDECAFLKWPSLFNCNSVFERDLSILINKLENNSLKMLGYVDSGVLLRLRMAVLKSPVVTRNIKKIIQLGITPPLL